jgi:biotin-dependent carboxylase-like uncharacterized protein
MSEIIIERAPMGVSLQDGGRKTYARFGIASAGSMDWARHAMANRMLGKHLSVTVIEIGPAGIGLTLKSGCLQFSFAGPRYVVQIDGRPISCPARAILDQGQHLEITPDSGAMWGYLAVQGAFDVPKYLGSYSENSVSGMRAISIEPGGQLTILDATHIRPESSAYIDPYIAYEQQSIGIIPSSQYAHFSQAVKEQLVSQPLSIEPRFDRMAYRVMGVQLQCDKGHDILSDGITMGAIQVPGDGQPFILMADHQTTGGYPKIACVCKADLPRIAQMGAGKFFRFHWESIEVALKRWALVNKQIETMLPLLAK